MEAKPGIKAHLILGILFAVTCGMLMFTVEIEFLDRAGIREELPVNLGEVWEGAGILFCQNPACARGWLQQDLPSPEDGQYACPQVLKGGSVCGGEMATGSFAEYSNLPSDTVIYKRRYQRRDLPEAVTVGVILSGRDRRSIHRPEVCMPSQGNLIQHQQVIDVPIDGREPLQVMVLELTREKDGVPVSFSYFAYWFVGQNRETPYHWERVKWMATDRIFHNVSHRWAYVHVAGNRSPEQGNTDHHQEIIEVVSSLYPEIILETE